MANSIKTAPEGLITVQRTISIFAFLCAISLSAATCADAGAKPDSSSSYKYKTQYTVRLSGFISAEALGPSLRSLIGNKPDTPFTLVGQCPTSNGAPDGWGMMNLTDVGKAVPIFFNVAPAPPGSLPKLGAHGFAIAKRLEAQQITIDPQMIYLNLLTPVLVFLAPADNSGSTWTGDVINGEAAGLSASVTEVTFQSDGTTTPDR
jgi:hypothetical protein